MQPLSSGFHQISEEAMAHTCSMLECLSQLQNAPWLTLLSGESCAGFVSNRVYFPFCTSWTMQFAWGRKSYTHCCLPDCWDREKQGWCPSWWLCTLCSNAGNGAVDSGLRRGQGKGQDGPRGTGVQWEVRWGSLLLSQYSDCELSHSFFCLTDAQCEKCSYHALPILCFPSPNCWVKNLHGHGMLPWAHLINMDYLQAWS